MTPAQIIAVAESGSNIKQVIVPALKSFWGHDVRYWRDVANVVMVWSLIIGVVGGAFVVISTKLSLDWSADIERHDNAVFEKYKVETAGKVAAATLAGIEAGKAASDAHGIAKTAEAATAKQKTLTAQAQLETQRLKAQLAWRELTSEQMRHLTALLSRQPMSASFWVPVPDPEAMALRDQILEASKRAGLKVGEGGTDFTASRLPFDTAVVGRRPDLERWESVLKAVGLTVILFPQEQDTKVYVMPKPRPK